MLNRTNLTLSALALSNRLNLGTRSLAAHASVNTGDKTQYIRQSHHGVMREGMVWSGGYPIPQIGPAFPSIPGSFSPAPQCPSQDVAVQCSCRVADVQVLVEPRPDNLAERPERIVSDCYPGVTATTAIKRARTQPVLLLDSRLRPRLSWLGGLKRDARATAPQLAAARQATTGK
ncbi:MAG: hypothetical protein ACLQVF_15215 [Isosphaeraceae bacterium]